MPAGARPTNRFPKTQKRVILHELPGFRAYVAMITAVVVAALMQSAAINNQRDNYLSCLDRALAVAKSQKMASEAVEVHLRQTCASAETSFESALIAFDLKNKVPRKQASADAELQVSDFITNLVDRYKIESSRQ